jgi:hypothetical protein
MRTLPVLLLALPGAAHAQGAPDSEPPAPRPAAARGVASVIRPLLEGAASGVALGAAYVAPGAGHWLVSDNRALQLGIGAGTVGALAAFAASTGLSPDAPDRPRLRLAVGTTPRAAREVTLALRAPVRGRIALEGMLLVRSADWERTGQETRCSAILGCQTGTYVLDHRYQQDVAALARVAYRLPTVQRLTPVLTAGVGRMASHVDAKGQAPVRRDGALLDAGVGLELGRISRWTVEGGVRGPIPKRSDPTRREPELVVRVGRAFGYR